MNKYYYFMKISINKIIMYIVPITHVPKQIKNELNQLF